MKNQGIHNSRSQFYWELFESTYHDVVGGLVSCVERERDLHYCKSRFELEGIQFLTKTLPSFAKAIDKSLANVDVLLDIPGFQKETESQIPKLFGGLTKHLFNTDGVPISADVENPAYCRETATSALKGIRQLGYLLYKLELPPTEDQVHEVLKTFIETDKGLPEISQLLFQEQSQDTPFLKEVLHLSRMLIQCVLANADPKSGIPKHGPGAVATGENTHEKHVFKRYYHELAREYDYGDWFFYNASHLAEGYEALQNLEELIAGTAKVVLVPKDSRGPRLISCEPLEYQWIQQAQLQVLVKTIESHPLTIGLVNFTDQTVNRELALRSSRTREFATLDMKEASDRVSLSLVKALFPENWYRALYASRSPSTMLPDGRIVHLKKFAPMGSAVCFPVEALVFWAISTSSLIVHNAGLTIQLRNQAEGYPYFPELVEILRRIRLYGSTIKYDRTREGLDFIDASFLRRKDVSVWVYGDDIICHSDNHGVVLKHLEAVGLKANQSKCCTNGSFKESCGCDAFDGVDVTPARMRLVLRRCPGPEAFVKLVGFANEAWAKGLYGTGFWMERQIRKLFPKWPLPIVSNDDPSVVALVRKNMPNDPGPYGEMRFNAFEHYKEYLGLAVVPTLDEVKDDGYSLMLREERKQQRDYQVMSGSSHVPTGHYPIARRNKLKRAWTVIS